MEKPLTSGFMVLGVVKFNIYEERIIESLKIDFRGRTKVFLDQNYGDMVISRTDYASESYLDEERREYDRRVQEELGARAEEHPSIFELEYRCPLCLTRSAIAKFKGNIYRAVCPCPDCEDSFETEPGHLMEAFYARAGLSTVV
ncbi:uncharacterized protein PV07_04194 [Cladophialophora immunda]|uniref:Uncharacterized protein n=1 Tax=Cladophialophora immunda TaxID=569365 RepID=A0A0D2CRS8_9EURO|nr:uncharacterized protein PV07_04194 [Cladophialophora immunda]KIW32665.1 hypothetical protein PV07_04194 [Cladophialophora immunda]